jgi:hypothetical protein
MQSIIIKYKEIVNEYVAYIFVHTNINVYNATVHLVQGFLPCYFNNRGRGDRFK